MKAILASARISLQPCKPGKLPMTHGQILRNIFYDSLGDLGRELHDSNEGRKFSIWQISVPPHIRRTGMSYELLPFHTGYFDIVTYSPWLIENVPKVWSRKRGKILRVGSLDFRVVRTNIIQRTERFFERPLLGTKVKISFKSPYHVSSKDNFGVHLDFKDITLSRLLEPSRQAYNYMVGEEAMTTDKLSNLTSGLSLDKGQSSLKRMVFPYYKGESKFIKKGHKGKLVFHGEVSPELTPLLKLMGYIGAGSGRTYGLGKVHVVVE